MRAMLLEDDDYTRQAVLNGLLRAGFAVDAVPSIVEAQLLVAANSYDCLVLDRQLPDGDSLDQLQQWRAEGLDTPALFLTARDAVSDRVAGFEAGGDDYLVKPFAISELVARVRRLGRQATKAIPAVITLGNVVLNMPRREVRRDDVLLSLTAKELSVLELLMAQPNVVVTKEALMEHCWDERTDPRSNTIEVHIASLRRKLGKPAFIRTVRGAGYIASVPE